MLILQFTEDVSDRDMERLLKENVAAKWFCQFGLTEKTPDHSSFGVFRKTLGTQGLMAIFGKVRDALKAQGLICEVFTFLDASQLVSKLPTWSERNKAIAKGLEKFNNAFMRQHRHRLVFIDETSVNTKLYRLRGRALKGQRLHTTGPMGGWKTQTFIAGLREYEMVAPLGLKRANEQSRFRNLCRNATCTRHLPKATS